jgi:hypothetical protein
MDALFAEIMASLRGGQQAIDQELHPLLQAENPDWSMLRRIRDVANEYAVRARQLRQMMTVGGVEADLLEELDRLCEYFDGMFDVTAQETEGAL